MLKYVISGNIIVFSDLYGDEGNKELRSAYLKLRLNRSDFKNEGSPWQSYLVVGTSKIGTVQAIASLGDFSKTQNEKKTTWYRRMDLNKSSVPMSSIMDDQDDEPIRHNKRDEDTRYSRKEAIRQNRRNNQKRHISDKYERDEDDESV